MWCAHEDRFLDGTLPTDDFTYIAFGGGRRICKGMEFGLLQVATSMMREDMSRGYGFLLDLRLPHT